MPGPVNTAKWLGVSREVLNKLSSPIDITLLRRFSMAEELHPGDPIWEVMRMIGEDLIRYISSLRERLNFISKHAEVWEIPAEGGAGTVHSEPRLADADCRDGVSGSAWAGLWVVPF